MSFKSLLSRLLIAGFLTASLTIATQNPQVAEAALSVDVPTSVQKVAAGDGFICALVSSKVLCSGKNTSGQLGDGTTTNRSYLAEVSDLRKIENARQIVAGKSHVCAISGIGSTSPPGQGTLYCWGDNQYGQLGTGNTTNSLTPVAVASNTGFTNAEVKGVIVGDHHTCAIQNVSSFDKLYCWGLNDKGQLGDTTTQNRSLPTAVQGVFASGTVFHNGTVQGKQAMAAGSEHTCAGLSSTKILYCWGENGNNQLGNNSTTDSATPVSTGLELVQAAGTYTSFISAGQDFTCAREGLVVKCWGGNANGQMGNGTTTNVAVPTAIPDNGSFVNTNANTIVAGGQTACFVSSSLIVWCWGANNAGQVGDNTTTRRDRPTRVADNSAAGFANGLLGGNSNNHAGIAIGNSVTDGFVCLTGWCWGGNATGQLALNNTTGVALATKMLVGTITPDDVSGVTATATYTANGVVVTFTGIPATGLSGVSITIAPTSQRLAPNQPASIGAPSYSATTFSGGTLPSVSGKSFSVTVPNMRTSTYSMGSPPVNGTVDFESTGSYHLTYSLTGTAATGYPDGWRARNGQVAGDTVTVTGTTSATTAAPATNDTPAATSAPAASASVPASGTTTGSYANAVPGVTVTDPRIYTAAPKKVADGSAISVLTSTQSKTLDITSLTPSICLPNDEDLVFLDEGRCIAQVVNIKTRKVLRTLKTTVVDDDIAELKVGNEVAVLAPLYFLAGTSTFKRTSLARLAKLKNRIEAAGSVLIAGHSGNLMGNTPENIALSGARARATVAALKARGSQGPFAIAAVGALDPASTGSTRADQDKNRRSVIVLIP